MTQAQKGFALIELAIAALLATLLAVWGANTLVSAMNEASARANAQWMLAVREGVRQYLQRYDQSLRHARFEHALNDAGYADWSTPRLAELKSDGLLPPDLPLTVAHGNSAQVRVLRRGACPGADCALDAIIHSTRPFIRAASGQVDEPFVAQWLMATEGLGGWVSGRDAHMLRGAGFALTNPAWKGPALPPGTVALVMRQSGDGPFLRVKDPRDPDFQGGLTVRGTITATTDLEVLGHIQLRAEEKAGTPCPKEGALAFQPRAGLIACQQGVWRPASQGVAGGYTHNSLSQCRAPHGSPNKYTGQCACPPGTQAIQMSEIQPTLLMHGVTRRFLCLD